MAWVYIPNKDLKPNPYLWAQFIEDKISGNFTEYNTRGKELLSDVELILSDTNVLEKSIGKSIASTFCVS